MADVLIGIQFVTQFFDSSKRERNLCASTMKNRVSTGQSTQYIVNQGARATKLADHVPSLLN